MNEKIIDVPEVQDDVQLSGFSHYDKVNPQCWNDMLMHFENNPFYNYFQVDKLKIISGYNLCEIDENQCFLWPINIEIKTGLYKIITDLKPSFKGIEQTLTNNFIFCINGEIFQYTNKKDKKALIDMVKEVYFHITRLTIVDKIEKDKKTK